MIRSQPIDIEGRFVGVAVQSSRRWQFVATDPRLGDLDGSAFDSPAEAARVAGLVLRRASQLLPPSPAVAPPRLVR